MLRIARLMAVFLALFLLFGTRAHAQDQKDREFQECVDCPVMVGIPAGSFVMGSPASEHGRFDSEGPQHSVSIRAFALGKFDVTSDEFLIFLRDTGYQPRPCNRILNMGWRSPGGGVAYPPLNEAEPPRWPAVCLDWRDADAYIAWLNARARRAHPDLARRSGPYRLPSEAEWEYAARAGSVTARWWGDEIGVNRANCNGCGSPWDNQVLSDVDAFSPNAFGLYGMLGNIWQWTNDCWNQSYTGAPRDGRAWRTGDCRKHVLRGAAWNSVPVFVRSAARTSGGFNGGEYDYSNLAGFRVARDLP